MQYEVTVGMPSFRIPPSGFGISTLLTGEGVYFPFLIFPTSSWLCSFSHDSAASMVIPSIPGAPLVRLHSLVGPVQVVLIQYLT